MGSNCCKPKVPKSEVKFTAKVPLLSKQDPDSDPVMYEVTYEGTFTGLNKLTGAKAVVLATDEVQRVVGVVPVGKK